MFDDSTSALDLPTDYKFKFRIIKSNQFLILYMNITNPHAPVAQKVADEVVFRRFQGEGVEFFF